MKYLKPRLLLIVSVLIISWTPASQAADIVIGFSGPLSGPAAEYGQNCVNGIDMAIKELNAAGGVTIEGQKLFFRLEKLDDKVDPSLAMNNARQLLAQNALAIYNATYTTQAALLKINQEECNEFITLGYTSSLKATQTGNKLLVVLGAPMTVYAQLFADAAWERGWRKAAMVVTLGTYGDEWRQVFGTYWKKLGGTITADKPANYYTKTDYTAPLSAALATSPDVMLIGGPSATTAMVIEQARNMGYKGGFLLVEQANMDYIAQMLDGTSLMENTIGLVGFDSMPTPEAPAFAQKHKANYKRPSTPEAIAHYDSMYYLARAIQAANTVDDVYAIRAAFPKAFPRIGPTETYGISPTGRVQIMVSLQSIRNGKFTKPEVYVWWTKTQAEFDKVQKVTKYTVPLKLFKSKIGTLD